jgi:sialidase-1
MAQPFFEIIDIFPPQLRDGRSAFYRIPTLAISRRGTVFAVNEERLGTIEDQFNQHNVALRRSFDNGKTWQPMQILSAEPGFRRSPGSIMADLEAGRVFVFFGRSPIFPEASQRGEAWVIEHPDEMLKLGYRQFVISTGDEGDTWSEPRDVTEMLVYADHFSMTEAGLIRIPHARMPVFTMYGSGGVQMRTRPYRGRLVVPARVWSKPVWDLNAYTHNAVVLSDDHGETWRVGGLSQPGMGEASVVELAGGGLYLNSRNESIRCRGYRGWDRSYDGGVTFTESGYDLALPEPHCHAALVRYSYPDEGRSRVLFCNPAVRSGTVECFDGPARHHLTVRLSYDECRTWAVSKVINEGPAGYSSLAIASDGTILCHYARSVSPGGQESRTGLSSVARFNLAWLTDGQDSGRG